MTNEEIEMILNDSYAKVIDKDREEAADYMHSVGWSSEREHDRGILAFIHARQSLRRRLRDRFLKGQPKANR